MSVEVLSVLTRPQIHNNNKLLYNKFQYELMRFWTSKWQWRWHWQFNGRRMVYSVLLDKGTGSEVTSPTSRLPMTHSRPVWYSSRIGSSNPVWQIQFCVTDVVWCFQHTTSKTKRDSQVKRCCFRAIETVNLKSRWIQPPGCSPPPYNTVYSMDVRWPITQAMLTQALLFCPC